ncbi:MAG: Phenylalanine--tRNA ligase [Candidatus Kaiserbacteria bacterium]|nr:Phenylalanine--tRNA ligase [Candidatus Kaiserbacteria bacterium]
MKISRNWLQTYFEEPLPTDAEISDALTFHVFEIDGIEHVGDDSVFDVKVTPNRGHDCLSHRGIAKELSAIFKFPIKDDVLSKSAPPVTNISENILLKVDDSAVAPVHILARIDGVTVGPSPSWLVERLQSLGQRSINNVVDATNYVMFGLGQPGHVFDYDKLQEKDSSKGIHIRYSKEGEHIDLLGGVSYDLPANILMLTDAVSGAPLDVAGIKGGRAAELTTETKNILLTVGSFDGPTIRKTAQGLKIRTDASSRYENKLPAQFCYYGVQELTKLITLIAGGEVIGYAVHDQTQEEHTIIAVTEERIQGVLGYAISGSEIADVFQRLSLAYKEQAGVFEVHIPFERIDLTIPEDLIEEVGRIIGYDTVPAIELPESEIAPAVNHQFYVIDFLRNFLVERGFSEVYTSVFTESGEQIVANKVDGVRPYLRDSLIAQLSDSLEKNIRNKDILGLNQVKLFEIGTVWYANAEHVHIAFAVEKLKKHDTIDTFVQVLEKGAGVNLSKATKTAIAAEIPLEIFENALMLTDSYDELPLSQTERYKAFSKYPAIVRDISLWCPAGTSVEEVQNKIQSQGGELLTSIRLFDQFEKEGRVSYAFRMVFQSMDRTLFEEDANGHVESITLALKAAGWEVR